MHTYAQYVNDKMFEGKFCKSLKIHKSHIPSVISLAIHYSIQF